MSFFTLFLLVASFLLGAPQAAPAGSSPAGAQANRAGQASKLDALIEHRKYLELEATLQEQQDLNPAERAYFEGVLANRRNQQQASIQRLEPLLPSLAGLPDHKRELTALRTLADDYVKTFQYAQAARIYGELDRRFGRTLSAADRKDIRSNLGVMRLLRDAPAQTATVQGDFTVSTKRDAIGLIEAPIDVGSDTEPWVLDTGANISTITQSMAQRLGLILSQGTASIEGISGAEIPLHTAIIPELHFGQATLRNVVVMVVADKDLFIPQIKFQIKAILGYPVFQALGKITFFANGDFGVAQGSENPQPQSSELFMEELMPVIAAETGGKQLLFTLDTGATGTILAVPYYREHRAELAGAKSASYQLAGAGGSRSVPACVAQNIVLKLAGHAVKLDHGLVLSQPVGTDLDHFYGNLGQDVLASFRSYTLDFASMRFTAEAKTDASAK